MAGIGHKRPFAGTSPKGSLQIRKRTIEPITAAHNDLFVRYVCFGISKRKPLISGDFAT